MLLHFEMALAIEIYTSYNDQVVVPQNLLINMCVRYQLYFLLHVKAHTSNTLLGSENTLENNKTNQRCSSEQSIL